MKAYIVCAMVIVAAWTTDGQSCPFMGTGRMAKPVTNLGNCSWYEYSACCERAEVSSVFQEMPPLQFASTNCRNRMNYLMCYFCSPIQTTFVTVRPGGNTRQTTICKEYCDDIYNHCKDTHYRGRALNSVYQSGTKFCESNGFRVLDSQFGCFKYNSSAFTSGSSSLVGTNHVHHITFFGLLISFFAFVLM